MFQAYNNNLSSFNVSHSNNINSLIASNTSNYGVMDEESKVLSWLSPLEPQVRYQDIRTQRVKEVGRWALQSEKFRSWCNGSGKEESDHAALFCNGHPGVGKSFITSLLIDSLGDQAGQKNIAVLCFYFDFASRKGQTPVNMLGSWLRQLVSGLEKIPKVIVKEYREQKKVIGGRGLQGSGIVRMFQPVSSTKPTFICIDTLDECMPEYRVEVLGSRSLILEIPKTRLFMTGRPHICGDVRRQLGETASGYHTKVMTSWLKEDIIKGVPEKISETFLLVSLNIESILREATIARSKGRLPAIADGAGLGLEDAYGATPEQIRAQAGAKSELLDCL